MSHTYNKVWIHAIWATKERQALIHSTVEDLIFKNMKVQFMEIGCKIETINGMPDHVHALFLLNRKKALSEIIKQIKGSTSHWINAQDLIAEKFSWQTGYAAFSVSESNLSIVLNYIQNQKAHHQKNNFAEEYDEFIKLHGLIPELMY